MRSITPSNRRPRAATWLRWVLCICSVTASWMLFEPVPAQARAVLRGAPRSCCAGKACACGAHACPCVKPGPWGSPAPAPEPAQLVPVPGSMECLRDVVRFPGADFADAMDLVSWRHGSTPPARAGTLLDLLGSYRI